MKFRTKVKFSMRLKIIMLLIFLISTSLSAYLFFAVDLFVKDKSAYLNESITNSIIPDVQEFRNIYEISYNKSTELIRDYLEQGRVSNNRISGDKSILAFFIKSKERIKILKNEALYNELKNLFDLKFDPVRKIELSKYLSKENFKNGKIDVVTDFLNFPAILIKLKSKYSADEFFTIVSFHQFSESLKRDSSFKKYVFDYDFNSLFEVEGSRKIGKESYLRNFLKETISAGAKEVRSADGEERLSAFQKIPEHKIIVVSEISKDKAYEVTSKLINSSIIAGLFCSAFAIVFAVIFSARLTRPIKELVTNTQKVAQRKYEELKVVKSNDELGLLSESFLFMGTEIHRQMRDLEEAKVQLLSYSQNLEEMVKMRTSELKKARDFTNAMVNSLDQGLVVFDEKNICNKTYTRSSEELFKQKPSNKNFFDVIGIKDKEKRSLYERWSTNVFKEIIPFDHLAGLGPKSVPNEADYKSPSYQFISLEYYPMRDDDGIIKNIVAVATDKTSEMRANLSFKEKEAQAEMILKLVKNKRQFITFVGEYRNYLNQIKASAEFGEVKYEKTLGALHSIKGGASLFSIKAVSDMAHDYEDEVLKMKKDKEEDSIVRKKIEDIHEVLSTALDEFMESNKSFLGDSVSDGEYRIELRRKDIELFVKEAESLDKEQILSKFKNEFYKEDVSEVFETYVNLVIELATSLGKKINPMIVQSNGLRLLLDYYSGFFSCLIHVYRNMVDHGIEFPENRVAKSKDEFGNIKTSLSKEIINSIPMLQVVIEDDGSGISPDKVRKKLKQIGLNEAANEQNDQKVLYYIFSDFFSTREETSETSGRGVGMAAVKEEIQLRGGVLRVESEIDVGTRFIFAVPLMEGDL